MNHKLAQLGALRSHEWPGSHSSGGGCQSVRLSCEKGMTNGVPQTLATRGGEPCHRYESAGQAYSNEMRAILRCVYPDDDARGYVRSSATDGNGGWDFGKFHLRHALERPKYPLCGCEVVSCFPRTDFARQSRTRTVVPAVQVQRSAPRME